jgi:iron complex transport system substrate-binding protein
MKRPWFIVLMVATFLFGVLLTACRNTATEVDSTAPDSLSGEAAGVIVVDALQRIVEFDNPPERIVVAGRSSLTIVDALFMFPEARERVAGLVVGKQPVDDFISLVDPTFGEKSILAPDAGAEQLAPLKPDVVVLRSFMAEQLGKALEQVDIPIVYVDLETPDQYFRDLATLGQLFGNQERAAEIESYYRSKLDDIDGGLSGLADSEKPRTLFLQYSNKGGEAALNVPSAFWIQTIEAELAGGEAIWKEAAQSGGWTVVNFEQIAAWDPDTLFVVDYSADSADAVERLKADPQWQALKAVENGQIYGFASDIFSWDQPDPRWLLGVIWLAGKLHPGRFPDLDMQQVVIEFFQKMYGMDKIAIEENILPRLTGDVE